MAIRTSRVFLDTSFAIAVSAWRDKHHDLALQLATECDRQHVQLVTTDAILLEIGNAFARRDYRPEAIRWVNRARSTSKIERVAINDDLFDRGFDLFCRREDKDWGLTDCTSFVLMETMGLTEALTADAHFEQAGFRALLRQ